MPITDTMLDAVWTTEPPRLKVNQVEITRDYCGGKDEFLDKLREIGADWCAAGAPITSGPELVSPNPDGIPCIDSDGREQVIAASWIYAEVAHQLENATE